jgi:CRP-like cAMP-binding protein
MRGSPRQVKNWSQILLRQYDFPSATQQSFEDIISACELRSYRPEQTILTEDTVGEEMFILLEGAVSVFKRKSNGENQHLVDMTESTVFGHMSLTDRSTRSATCIAIGDVILACMPQKTYDRLLTSPSMGTVFRRLMLSTLTRQLVMSTDKLAMLLSPTRAREHQNTRTVDQTKTDSMLESDDISLNDILDLAGVTMGWKFDTEGVDDVQFVLTEDDSNGALDPES